MICTYQKTIYQNEGNGFCICVFATDENAIPSEARNSSGMKGLAVFTATGYNLPDNDAVDYEINGHWENKGKYGLQLAVDSCIEIIPKTRAGLIGYIGSGLIKGVGPKIAKAIVAEFGLDALDVMEKEPERLIGIKGITTKKLELIKDSLLSSRGMRDIVSYLSPYGITVNKAVKILKEFGGCAMEVLRNQPFKLCAISGFGFKIVDEIARKTGCSLNDPLRIQGGLKYVLDEAAASGGHLFLPKSELENRAMMLLNDKLKTPAVTKQDVQAVLGQMLREGSLCSDVGNIYRPADRDAEATVAFKVISLLKSKIQLYGNLERELALSQSRLNITLADKQVDAVRTMFHSPLSIITGGPGTGKTTVLRVILDIYKRVRPDGNILLAAPTGRASRRMVESTGFPEASTLHSALGLFADDDNEFASGWEPVNADLMIVDEVSMIDMHLAAELFRRIRTGAQLLLVGDADQLPSVGPGNVLRELIRSRVIPTTLLDFVYRQKNTSRIAVNAHAINIGNKGGITFGDDFALLPAESAEEAADAVLSIYMAEVDKSNVENVQILAPFKSRGASSVRSLNERARELVNPRKPGSVEQKFGNRIFRVGDKVLQTRNRAQDKISNGDIGFISQIHKEDGSYVIVVQFSDGRLVDYTSDQIDQLELAYAMTIHKSQGGEYKSVIIPILMDQYIMLRRNLIYTAITRAKSRLILVGQKKALWTAIDKSDVDKRNTLLADRIVTIYREKVLNAS